MKLHTRNSQPKYHRSDICEAARKYFCTCKRPRCKCKAKKIGLEELNGVVRVRTYSGNWEFCAVTNEERQRGITQVAREIDVHEFWRGASLAEIATLLGVKKRL